MRKNRLIMYLFSSLTLAFFILPMQAVASYEFSDEFQDGKFHKNWISYPSGSSSDTQRGDWNIIVRHDGSPFDNKPYACTLNNKEHTFLYRSQIDGIATAKNYQMTATISAGDDDSMGLLFYYKDNNNYYRLTVNNREFGTADYGPDGAYPHSVFLKRVVDGTDELLAITPMPATYHDVVPFNTIQLRVQIITDSNNHKYILPQYFNPSVYGWVNLFDTVIEDDDTSINFGWAGVDALYMEDRHHISSGGNLHFIEVKGITNIFNIVKANLNDDGENDNGDRDPFLLDYRDDDGNEFEFVELKFNQYPPPEPDTDNTMHWFKGNGVDDKIFIDSKGPGETVEVNLPLGKHSVYLYEELIGDQPDEDFLASEKEIWLSSSSSFTIAVLPDLHVHASSDDPNGEFEDKKYRDLQIEGILREVAKRELEDNIKACIQVGDIAQRGRDFQVIKAKELFTDHLPINMPLITALGNHDYDSDDDYVVLENRRYSQFPDEYIFPVVTNMSRISEDKYGVEIPSEIDNMYYLFDESDLGGAGSNKWLVLSLQVDPRTMDLFWAEKIIKSYPDYNVIIVTHQFLDEYNDSDDIFAENSIGDDVIRDETNPLFKKGHSPKAVWEFLKKHEQVKIILDGHTSAKGGLITKTIKRDCGSDVLAILTDVSYAHTNEGAGGQFRLLEIDPYQDMVRGRLVYARTNDHVDYPDTIEGQAINTAHGDTYFIARNDGDTNLDLSNKQSPNVLLFEDFNRNILNNHLPPSWIVSDCTGNNCVSSWQVSMNNSLSSDEVYWRDDYWIRDVPWLWSDLTNNTTKYGRVREIGNAYSCNDNQFLKGTYLFYDNTYAKDWSNYIFELDMEAGDNDGIGFMFYYTDDKNYYRFSMFKQGHCGQANGYCYLEKIVDGKRTLINKWEKEYSLHKLYRVVVDLSKTGNIKINIFDSLSQNPDHRFLHINEDDPTHTNGTIGLYAWGMDQDVIWRGEEHTGAIFDNVLVTTGSTEHTLSIITPQAHDALQDGVTFKATASNNCGLAELFFSIREAGGTAGIPVGYEGLPAVLNDSGEWELYFDTTLLKDGYYVVLAKEVYDSGTEGWSDPIPFSIRNWAVIELLPASSTYRAGRTMPVKFSLRISSAVDPAHPFVYNEGLEIRVYDKENNTLLQSSLYGDTSIDYRIDSESEIYITNFKTSKTPSEYLVEIWRPSHNFLIGGFIFETVKK